MITSAISKKNLLNHAMKIGGRKMYFGLRKALRQAGLFENPELNKKQLNNTLYKLMEVDDFHIDKQALEKLIDKHERRRIGFIKMGIEEDIEEEQLQNPSSVLDFGFGKKRYGYKKPQRATSTALSRGATSISRIGREKNSLIQNSRQQTNRPTTSISRIGRK